VDPRLSIGKYGDEAADIADVCGQNRLAKTDRHADEVRVDDVGGAGATQDRADRAPVVKWMYGDRSEKPREPGLPRPLAPNLRNNGLGAVKRRVAPHRGSEKLLCGPLAAIDRHEKRGVQDQRS